MLAPEASTAEAAPTPVPVGDAQALDRLRKWGGDRLVHDILEIFFAQVPERIADARRGIWTNEPIQVERAAHILKSSSGQLGAARMRVLCIAIESLAARQDLSRLPAMVDELESEFGSYVAWLRGAADATESPAMDPDGDELSR